MTAALSNANCTRTVHHRYIYVTLVAMDTLIVSATFLLTYLPIYCDCSCRKFLPRLANVVQLLHLRILS